MVKTNIAAATQRMTASQKALRDPKAGRSSVARATSIEAWLLRRLRIPARDRGTVVTILAATCRLTELLNAGPATVRSLDCCRIEA